MKNMGGEVKKLDLAIFYKQARLKWLYKILLKHEQHPIRYSIINPITGAEWFFDQKKQTGPKIRWERFFFGSLGKYKTRKHT